MQLSKLREYEVKLPCTEIEFIVLTCAFGRTKSHVGAGTGTASIPNPTVALLCRGKISTDPTKATEVIQARVKVGLAI